MSKKHPYAVLPQERDSEEELTIYDKKFGENTYNENEELIFRSKSGQKRFSNPSTSLKARVFTCGVVIVILLIVVLITGYSAIALWNNTMSVDTNSTVTEMPSAPPNKNETFHHISDANSWRAELNGGQSELSVLIHDVNKDGIPDVIVDSVTSRFQTREFSHCPGQHDDECKEKYGFSPCQSRILALNGKSGAILWNRWVQFDPFAANCREDFNLDGLNDCLFAGRVGAFVAFDIHNDELLWVADSSLTCPAYNYFYPLISKDFNKDGVNDIIMTHGGDPLYPDSDKKRTPGFLVVVSGLTGQQLSNRILTPDNHETYSSPILYTLSDGTELILFGSGGETISGSLWAVTLESLQNHVTHFVSTHKTTTYTPNKIYKPVLCYSLEELQQLRPQIEKNAYLVEKHEKWMEVCPMLSRETKPIWNKYNLCVYEFIPAGTAGTVLPPVVVDINKDGKMDLVISQFNDHTILYDGGSGSIAWDHYNHNTQTYSVPAPIHFNNDDTLDILVRFNKGHWMTYDYSYMGILDGNNGELLWSLNCSQGVMSSPVTLQHKNRGQDGMLFIAIGCGRMPQKETIEENESGRRRKRSDICPRTFFENYGQVYERKEYERKEAVGQEGFFPDSQTEGSGNNMHSPVNPAGTDIDFSQFLPDDLWEIRDNSDSFPDPWKKTEEFIEDYCEYEPDLLEASVYFLTPELTSTSKINPLFVFQPYVYKPSSISTSSTQNGHKKRHGDSDPEDSGREHSIMELMKNRKALRCAHILAPVQSASTPAITDVNGDGKLDAVVSIAYSEASGKYGMPELSFLHPPKVVVQTFTLEDMLKAIYKDSAANVDFSSYYSMDKQPWTEYMGRNGDGIFVNPPSGYTH